MHLLVLEGIDRSVEDLAMRSLIEPLILAQALILGCLLYYFCEVVGRKLFIKSLPKHLPLECYRLLPLSHCPLPAQFASAL